MATKTVGKRKGYIAIGGAGLVVGASYLGLALELPFGALDQPGAAVFPVAVGILMLLVSLAAIWEGWRLDIGEQVEFPIGDDLRRLLGLVGLLLVYFVTLPWLGQLIGSALFCAGLIRLLSTTGWLRSLVYGLVMAVVLYAVFVVAFKVSMPRGILAF
jgi:putative tricarboxylic transport membrane protein